MEKKKSYLFRSWIEIHKFTLMDNQRNKELGGNYTLTKFCKNVPKVAKNSSKWLWNWQKTKGYVDSNGDIWSEDPAKGSNSHGGSKWKKYKNKNDFEKDKREGTYNEDGQRIRD